MMNSVTPTPRIDAVMRWIDAGRLGPIRWPYDDDPLQGLTVEQRRRFVINSCASGAPAPLPVWRSPTGHPIPAPPPERHLPTVTHMGRTRKAKKRKRKP